MSYIENANPKQMARTVVGATVAAGLLASAGAAMIVSAAAKPVATEFGDSYCAVNNYDKVGGITVLGDDRKCCFWEKTGENEGIRICLQCDENWKNCKETLASRAPGLSTPPRLEKEAPTQGRSGAGTPTRLLNRTFKLHRQAE